MAESTPVAIFSMPPLSRFVSFVGQNSWAERAG